MNKTELKGVIEAHEQQAYKDLAERLFENMVIRKVDLVLEELAPEDLEAIRKATIELQSILGGIDTRNALAIAPGRNRVLDIYDLSAKDLSSDANFSRYLARSLDNKSHRVLIDMQQVHRQDEQRTKESYGLLYDMLKAKSASDMQGYLTQLGFNMEKTTYAKPKKQELNKRKLNVEDLRIGG